jgi:hypothetical protein
VRVATFYIDENVSYLLDDFLRGYGHTVISTHDEGREGSPDPHQLFYATERGWALITHNAGDFRLLHDAWHFWTYRWQLPYRHAGIIIAPQSRGYTPAFVAAHIDALTKQEDAFTNTLYDLQPAAGWVRTPRPRA